MTQAGYKQFCPVAMASEVLCTRWTMVLMRELVAGTTRFNDLRRGVPKMSPALLSTRLKELELAGVVERKPSKTDKGISEPFFAVTLPRKFPHPALKNLLAGKSPAQKHGDKAAIRGATEN